MTQLLLPFKDDGFPEICTLVRQRFYDHRVLLVTTPYGRRHHGDAIKRTRREHGAIVTDKKGTIYRIGIDYGGEVSFQAE